MDLLKKGIPVHIFTVYGMKMMFSGCILSFLFVYSNFLIISIIILVPGKDGRDFIFTTFVGIGTKQRREDKRRF